MQIVALYLVSHMQETRGLSPHVQPSVTLYYDLTPSLQLLPNGSFYISEFLVSQSLKIAGVDGLAYLLAHELSHLQL